MNPLVRIILIVVATAFLTQCERRSQEATSKTTMNEEDADYDLVRLTYDKINEQIRETGWDNISDEHRHIANVVAAYSKIENGGFGGFYFDSEHLPDMLADLAVSLEVVGATRAKELLLQSTQQFKGGIVSAGMDERIEVAQKHAEDYDPFEDLDAKFYDEAEPYIELLANYIRANPAAFQ